MITISLHKRPGLAVWLFQACWAIHCANKTCNPHHIASSSVLTVVQFSCNSSRLNTVVKAMLFLPSKPERRRYAINAVMGGTCHNFQRTDSIQKEKHHFHQATDSLSQRTSSRLSLPRIHQPASRTARPVYCSTYSPDDLAQSGA